MLTLRDSTILKGIAILFMLYLHLFNQISNVELCTTFISINGVPLVNILSRCTNPVAFFIILSGYGLYISYSNGKKNSSKRLIKLYIHYWITLLIFVPLGFFIVGSQKYPGNISDIISNVTGWYTTYNGEIWFLFPYVLVMLSSPIIIKYVVDKLNPWLQLSLFLIINMGSSFIISRYGSIYLYTHMLAYMPILYVQFLFSFTLGAQMAKHLIFRKINNWGGQNICVLLLVGLICFRAMFSTGAFHSIYAALFIILFAKIKRPLWLDNFLLEMGKRSTSMWFVHSYFCYYFFHDFIYGFKYPVLIFAVLLAISYACAIIIDYINDRVQISLHLKTSKVNAK